MKAIELKAAGGPEQFQYIEMSVPALKEEEVLIQVKAISINPVDVKSRSGKGVYGRIKDEKPLILGWDVSGTVVETTSTKFKIGDEVFGMINFPGHGKAYAEYVSASADQIALKPESISHAEAAGATLVALTAWQALVENANVQPGQHVLIHGASGGVGHVAVQIAKYLGAIVTGTSSKKNREFVLNLGADKHIDYQNHDWQSQAPEYDFVLDTIGGENIDHSLEVTKEGGTIISIPTGLNDAVTEKARLRNVTGYFILVKSSGEDMQSIAELLQQGVIKLYVSNTFDFNQMGEAHAAVETGRTVGKVVVNLT